MRVAFFDASAGASGDMILGALVDAGLPLDDLREVLERLPVSGWRLESERVKRRGVAATKVTVVLEDESPPHRHLSHILDILAAAELPEGVAERAGEVFGRLAEAEAKVHGTSVERVHFHEVGAIDAIVDIVGAVAGLALLGVEQVRCSPLPVSHGWVDCAHGRIPVPAWATLELLRGVPTRPLDVDGEVLTPTGAALLTTLATFAPRAMTPTAIGYGAGGRESMPGGAPVANVLRLVLGEASEGGRADDGRIAVLEANLDDMNPEWYEAATKRLFAAGALDVTLSPLQMKKGRPGVLLQVLGPLGRRDELIDMMLRETTTLGVRWYEAQRACLDREGREVETPYGPVEVKIGRLRGEVINLAPEYESCRSVAERRGVPLPAVYAAAYEAARTGLAPPPEAE